MLVILKPVSRQTSVSQWEQTVCQETCLMLGKQSEKTPHFIPCWFVPLFLQMHAPPAWNQVSVLTWAVTTVSIPASTISFPHSNLSYPWNRDFHLLPRKEVKIWPHTCLLKNLSYHFLPMQGPSNSLAGNIKSKKYNPDLLATSQ